MSVEKIYDLLKIIAPLLVFLCTVIGFFYNMYFKVKVIKDYDKIFLKKDEVQKINFMDSLFNYFLFVIGMYVAPATGISMYVTERTEDISQLSKNILLSFLFLLLIIFIISIAIYAYIFFFSNIRKKLKHKKRNLIITFISIISSSILYSSMLTTIFFEKQSEEFMLSIILWPIILSLVYSSILNFYNNKAVNTYLVSTIEKKELDKLSLIQSHMLDNDKIVLYERNTSIEDTFYMCDYSSEVYLKYQKQNIYKPDVIRKNPKNKF
ncbi:TPA: hypothetical protein QCV70_000622 [Bacillus cereus]|uniref:hypothetical protein n=1 Tax=Bacillus cereus group TaxID=86661 RepID=UPI00211CFB77|nr:hypothetical protein [Bacillus cereus]UUN16071.1 hypothetical protein LRS65_18640 [Bacillus cereus]HDR6753823.1 hypothetical protein [Bacillus cereus]